MQELLTHKTNLFLGPRQQPSLLQAPVLVSLGPKINLINKASSNRLNNLRSSGLLPVLVFLETQLPINNLSRTPPNRQLRVS